MYVINKNHLVIGNANYFSTSKANEPPSSGISNIRHKAERLIPHFIKCSDKGLIMYVFEFKVLVPAEN